MLVTLAVILSTIFTSALSGVFGMAGGSLLILILVSLLPVSSAMILHAVAQLTANGSRALILRRHICWQPLPGYLLGALLAILFATWLVLIPDPGVILILVGLFPWLGRWSRRLSGLDITHQPTAIFCGAAVTAAQLFAGAAGPLLDMFYLKSSLSRQAIVASKAFTQTLGHLLRILYYGVLVSAAETTDMMLALALILAAVLGTRLGTLMLARWNDGAFRRTSEWIILSIATLCLIRGSYLVMTTPLTGA
ncbi:MAG TPA: permease [Gammaproteobacteria bacterium]|nr:MAG: sulfite exporter TauE/SafE family protein [Gammaproteobacteria bacterium TMED134]HAL42525.1 permease [Gammaproteobacteria bacterium]|tara:strand:+ start:11063 stop:11815 length:753 start_codon:yes stop_codon:yes gene_type:complete